MRRVGIEVEIDGIATELLFARDGYFRSIDIGDDDCGLTLLVILRIELIGTDICYTTLVRCSLKLLTHGSVNDDTFDGLSRLKRDRVVGIAVEICRGVIVEDGTLRTVHADVTVNERVFFLKEVLIRRDDSSRFGIRELRIERCIVNICFRVNDNWFIIHHDLGNDTLPCTTHSEDDRRGTSCPRIYFVVFLFRGDAARNECSDRSRKRGVFFILVLIENELYTRQILTGDSDGILGIQLHLSSIVRERRS